MYPFLSMARKRAWSKPKDLNGIFNCFETALNYAAPCIITKVGFAIAKVSIKEKLIIGDC